MAQYQQQLPKAIGQPTVPTIRPTPGPVQQPQYTYTTRTVMVPLNELSPEYQKLIRELGLVNQYNLAQRVNQPRLFDIAYSAKLRSLHINPQTGEPIWNEIPVEERKYYPGAQEYFSSLSDDEKIDLIGPQNINTWIKRYQDVFYIDPTFKQRVYSAVVEYDKKYGAGHPDNLTQGVANVLWRDIVDVDPKGSYYASLDPATRIVTTFFQAARQAGVGLITFPLTVVEFAGKQITGTEVNVPVVSGIKRQYEQWETRQTVGPPDLISRGVSELGTRVGLTSEEERAEMQRQQERYPFETGIATAGSIAGMYAFSGGIGFGKTAISKVFTWTTTKLGRPLLLSAFRPTILARTAFYKAKGITGTIRKAPLESKISKAILTAEKKGEVLTYGQVPYDMGISMFKRTKGAIRPGEYAIVHTSPAPISTFSKFKVKDSASESSLLSSSPYGEAVPEFFGVEPSFSTGYRFSILPKIKRPTMTAIPVKEIVHLPKGAKSIEAAEKVMKTQPKGQYAVVSPKMELGRGGGLVEPEVGIWKGTTGQITSTPEYIMYKGIAIPEKRGVLFNAPIKPEWELSKIPKLYTKPTSSYMDYLASSTDIIRTFKKTSKGYAKDVFKGSAKLEAETTGKFTTSLKNYTRAIKNIEKQAKEMEFKLQEWQKPTTFGQLKLKGFKSIEGTKRELGKAFTEKPGKSSIPISTTSLKSTSYKYYKPSKSTYKYTSYSKPSYSSETRETYESSRPSYPSYRYSESRPSPRTIRTPIPIPFAQQQSEQKEQKGYDVYIKSNSTWIKQNSGALDEKSALGMGAFNSDEFKIKRVTSELVSHKEFYSSYWSQHKNEYTKRNDVYIKKQPIQQKANNALKQSPRMSIKLPRQTKSFAFSYKPQMVKI